jgi:peptidyl-prolyl cis-trans isomerase C
LAAAIILGAMAVLAAADKENAKPAPSAAPLFADDSLCKGKGVDVRRSQVDESMLQFKANLTARGQVLPEDKRELVESQILDRLVVTQILLNRANEEDRVQAKELARKFVKDTKVQAGSDDAFERQLLAMGFTQRQFEDQIMDRAISEAVVDRELKDKIKITDEQAKKYYDENGKEFEQPEMVRAAHILLSTRDLLSGSDLTEDQKKQKQRQMEKILERARKGEDFAALAKEFSEDPDSKDKGGEYTFPRGRMMPAFETAAFSLKTNEVSDIVITPFGFHVIKLYEKIPAQTIAYADAEKKLKDLLALKEVQKGFPDYVEKLKKEANLQYLNGAKPPAEPSAGQPSGKPEAKPDAK